MAREMKDSGIQWIGEIPSQWNIEKIGQLYSERKEKVSDIDYQPLSVTMKGIVPQLSTAAKSDAHDDRKLVKKGDFAINSRSDRRGSCGISEYEGSVSLINTILCPRKSMNPSYYNWLFHTTLFSDEFYKWGHGIVDDLWTTNWSEMKSIMIPQPLLEEQHRIASFLDSKCAEIDKAIETTKALIEEYRKLRQAVITEAVTKGLDPDVEMKNSSLSWIGLIPKDWHTIRIKFCSTLKGRIGWQGLTTAEYTDEGPYLVTGVDFNNGSIDWIHCNHVNLNRWEEDPYIQINNGDLLITKDGTVGKVAIVSELKDKATLNSGVLLIRPKRNNYDVRYLYWVLCSDVFKKWFADINAGNSTIIHLYQGDFFNFSFPLPNLEKQRIIASFLDTKCAEIDSLIKSKEKLIEELTAYRKSLIYEYVTGKKEVPAL